MFIKEKKYFLRLKDRVRLLAKVEKLSGAIESLSEEELYAKEQKHREELRSFYHRQEKKKWSYRHYAPILVSAAIGLLVVLPRLPSFDTEAFLTKGAKVAGKAEEACSFAFRDKGDKSYLLAKCDRPSQISIWRQGEGGRALGDFMVPFGPYRLNYVLDDKKRPFFLEQLKAFETIEIRITTLEGENATLYLSK